MDIPQVLASLRPGQDWGPLAQTGVAYADFAAAWRGASPVPTEQEMLAEWATLEAARPVRDRDARRTAAQALAAAPDPTVQLLRAQLLVLIDEVNALRAWVTTFKAGVAGAAAFSNFKTATAATANLPARTPAQIKPALAARINTADAD